MLPARKVENHKNFVGWEVLRSAPLFAGISPEDFQRITAAARLKRFSRAKMLFSEGDNAEHVVLLISGFAKVTQVGPKSAPVILRLAGPGDVLGTECLFSNRRHCTTAQAVQACGSLIWQAPIFEALVESLPIFHRNLVRFTCSRLEELERRFSELATEIVALRIAHQLFRLQQQIGTLLNGEMKIGLSHKGLAQMTGTTVYTVSRLLSAWQAHGWINIQRESVIILDARSLRKLIDESPGLLRAGSRGQSHEKWESSLPNDPET